MVVSMVWQFNQSDIFSLTGYLELDNRLNNKQLPFTNCVHNYDRAHNVHENGVMHTRKLAHGIDFYVKIIWICQSFAHPIML